VGVPEEYHPLVERSWQRDDPTLYGRFDFAYDGRNPPKLLEYNADTPTALLEAAVVQWAWLEDVFPGRDQFNRIHEALLEQLLHFREKRGVGQMHFSSVRDSEEDWVTVEYLRDLATQAGIENRHLVVDEIGYEMASGRFVDMEMRPVETLFKLYPWEWLVREEFGPHLLKEPCRVVEPPWKMALSTKGLLTVLWELFPGHPNLLPTYHNPQVLRSRGVSYVRKPLYSREGANVTLFAPSGERLDETAGDYGLEGFVYQEYVPLPEVTATDGTTRYPVLGSWVVGGESAGLGIREGENSRITGNQSRFVPHVIGD
jgi:glutathionylspermidine synthase